VGRFALQRRDGVRNRDFDAASIEQAQVILAIADAGDLLKRDSGA